MMMNLKLFVIVLIFSTHTYAQDYGPSEDYDKDGIINSIDLDDDNDGILDTDENLCEGYIESINSISNIYNQNNAIGEQDNAGASFINQNSYMVVDFGHNLTSNTVLKFRAKKIGIISKSLKFTPSDSNGNPISGSTANTIEITNTSFSDGSPYWFTLDVSTQYILIERDDLSNQDILLDYISHLAGNNCTTFIDIDNDLIPDKFDLDSDGDGCPDALEAGSGPIKLSNLVIFLDSNIPLNQQRSIGSIKGNVFSNGIPIIASNGLPIGSSRNAFNISDECAYWCDEDDDTLDTDGDGRPDACDIDDDNDGILDIDEGVKCTVFGYYFDGQRTIYGTGTLGNILNGDIVVVEEFIREQNADGSIKVGGITYDLRVELITTYPGLPAQVINMDATSFSGGSPDELVVFTGGSPASNPHIILDMNFVENNTISATDHIGTPILLAEAAIRFSDIDSSRNQNYTDVVGVNVAIDPNNIKSGTVVSDPITLIESGGFDYDPDNIVSGINNDFDLYRLKKSNDGTWTASTNAPIPNADLNNTAGYKFTILGKMRVVWGYTTTTDNPETVTTLTRGLSFSKDEVRLCIVDDTDLDGIANLKDLDSDGDGCPDAVESDGIYTLRNGIEFDNRPLADRIPGGNNADGTSSSYNGTVTVAAYETLQFGSGSSNSYGIPEKVNNYPVPDDRTNTQGIGYSQDSSLNGCSCEKAKIYSTTVMEETMVGITTMDRSIGNMRNIINQYSDGFIALESKVLGFVPTRIANPETIFDQTLSTTTLEDDAVEGMVVWDSANNCLRLYNGTKWKCINRTCDEEL